MKWSWSLISYLVCSIIDKMNSSKYLLLVCSSIGDSSILLIIFFKSHHITQHHTNQPWNMSSILHLHNQKLMEMMYEVKNSNGGLVLFPKNRAIFWKRLNRVKILLDRDSLLFIIAQNVHAFYHSITRTRFGAL